MKYPPLHIPANYEKHCNTGAFILHSAQINARAFVILWVIINDRFLKNRAIKDLHKSRYLTILSDCNCVARASCNVKRIFKRHSLEEFENAALFLRLGRPSTIICREHGAFRKGSSHQRNLKTPALCLSVDRNIYKRRSHQENHVISSSWVFLKHKSKMTGDCCVFKFFRRGVHIFNNFI